jgi:hypothetical protein
VISDVLHEALPYVVGLGGVLIGVIGLVQARKARAEAATSNKIAREANDISRGANGLAAEANEISRAGSERATERHDVDWETDWHAPGLYRVINTGRDTAHKVRIQVTVDTWVESAELDAVLPNQPVYLEFELARNEYERETAGRAASDSLSILASGAYYHRIRDRITWTTDLGSPREYDETANLSSLGPT